MAATVEELNRIIERGFKIIVDKEKYEITITEGLQIIEDNFSVLTSTIQIEKTNQMEEFLNSDKFKRAVYSPKTRGIILIDVAGYSKVNTLCQGTILSIFNQIIKDTISNMFQISRLSVIDGLIPTGDGCFIIFNENMNDNVFKTASYIISRWKIIQIHTLRRFGIDLKDTDRLHIRISCTLNETESFMDLANNKNFYGVGLNEAARILSCGQTKVGDYKNLDAVFFDRNVYDQALEHFSGLKSIAPYIELENLGLIYDKHGFGREVWCMRNLPENLTINPFS